MHNVLQFQATDINGGEDFFLQNPMKVGDFSKLFMNQMKRRADLKDDGRQVKKQPWVMWGKYFDALGQDSYSLVLP